MTGLIKNEIIKTYKSGFIKAALCVILALCIIVPVGRCFINREIEYLPDSYYSDAAENAAAPVEKEYYTAYRDSEKFFVDNGMYYNWQYESYYGSLLSLRIVSAACRLAANGHSQSEAEQYFMYEEMNTDVSFDERHNVVFSEENYKTAFELEKDELSVASKKIDKMISELEKYIKDISITETYKDDIKYNKNKIAELKIALEGAEAELKKNPENPTLIYARDSAKGALKAAELDLWGAEYLNNNKCEYDSWQKTAVYDILMNVSVTYMNSVPMNEEMFLKSEEAIFYKNYKTYINEINSALDSAEKTEKTVRYALEKNIPLPECSNDSVRENFDSSANFAAVLVSILMVAVAATTMFSEYSTGSIRLLLIRPKSRSKILLSKLITVIIYGTAAMAASLIVVFALNMLLHGDRDITVPYLLVGSDGSVKELAPIIFILIRVFLKLLSSFVIVSAVFLISSVFTKGGILALAIGSAATCSVPILTAMALAFNSEVKGIFSYTILPYLDMSEYFGTYLSGYSMSGNLFDNLLDMSTMRGEFSPIIGAVMVTVHIALFIGLAFYGFNKKQIKN